MIKNRLVHLFNQFAPGDALQLTYMIQVCSNLYEKRIKFKRFVVMKFTTQYVLD